MSSYFDIEVNVATIMFGHNRVEQTFALSAAVTWGKGVAKYIF